MRLTKTATWLAAGAALATVAAGTAVASALPEARSGGEVVATSVADDTLAERLAFNREEERMARDLYRLFARRYDVARPFAMIARSEQRHFQAVGSLLDTYGVADPSAGLPAGTYADPDLQTLYRTLRTQGLRSLAQAYQAGIAVEERDIADLDATLGAFDQEDVQLVLGRLADGSQMHLQAFQRVSAGGGSAAGWGGRSMMRGGMHGGQRGGMMRGWLDDEQRSGRGPGDCPMAS